MLTLEQCEQYWKKLLTLSWVCFRSVNLGSTFITFFPVCINHQGCLPLVNLTIITFTRWCQNFCFFQQTNVWLFYDHGLKVQTYTQLEQCVSIIPCGCWPSWGTRGPGGTCSAALGHHQKTSMTEFTQKLYDLVFIMFDNVLHLDFLPYSWAAEQGWRHTEPASQQLTLLFSHLVLTGATQWVFRAFIVNSCLLWSEITLWQWNPRVTTRATGWERECWCLNSQ